MDFFLNRPSFKTLKNKKNLLGAEIGVADGQNASQILQNLDIQTLYLIDPYCHYNNLKYHGVYETDEHALRDKATAKERLKKYGYDIFWINQKSEDAVKYFDNQSLDFVYIDSNHRYEYVKQDILLWIPKVKIGGQLAGHDW